jgi:multidrug efflux pump subunit AcrB
MNVAAAEALLKIQTSLSFWKSGSVLVTVSYPKDQTEKILDLSSVMTLAVRGINREETTARSELVSEAIRKTTGPALAAINLRPSGKRPEIRLFPNREAVSSLGVSAAGMAGALYAATEGIITGDIEIEGRRVDIRIAGNLSDYSRERFEKIPLVFSGSGKEPVPLFLGSLNKIEWREAEAALARQDRSDVVYLDLVSSPGKEKELTKLLKKLPADVSRSDESVFSRYRSSLTAAVILVIALLYLSLAAQFESFTLPFILMMGIPFSLAGSGPALFLSGSAADSGSVLGLIVLFGLAVNNGLVLYEASEEKLRSGLSPARAVYSGALERFRPVLITSLTTIFALVPLLSEVSQRSMAAAMLGGICTSTLLSFFALPPVFIFLVKHRGGRHG